MLPMTAFVSTIMFGYSLLHYKFYQHRRALCTTIVCLVRPLVFFFLVLQQLFISLTSIIFFQFYPLMLYSHIFKLRKLIHLVCYVVFGKLINVQALNCCWNLREEKDFFIINLKKLKNRDQVWQRSKTTLFTIHGVWKTMFWSLKLLCFLFIILGFRSFMF